MTPSSPAWFERGRAETSTKASARVPATNRRVLSATCHHAETLSDHSRPDLAKPESIKSKRRKHRNCGSHTYPAWLADTAMKKTRVEPAKVEPIYASATRPKGTKNEFHRTGWAGLPWRHPRPRSHSWLLSGGKARRLAHTHRRELRRPPSHDLNCTERERPESVPAKKWRRGAVEPPCRNDCTVP